uniref:Uncharacterized protein n=1 Tax=Anguilla anguilla TaxID=7936 RepID=A0A0E9VR97_ANGAN
MEGQGCTVCRNSWPNLLNFSILMWRLIKAFVLLCQFTNKIPNTIGVFREAKGLQSVNPAQPFINSNDPFLSFFF